jgi:hypothetical protein
MAGALKELPLHCPLGHSRLIGWENRASDHVGLVFLVNRQQLVQPLGRSGFVVI